MNNIIIDSYKKKSRYLLSNDSPNHFRCPFLRLYTFSLFSNSFSIKMEITSNLLIYDARIKSLNFVFVCQILLQGSIENQTDEERERERGKIDLMDLLIWIVRMDCYDDVATTGRLTC